MAYVKCPRDMNYHKGYVFERFCTDYPEFSLEGSMDKIQVGSCAAIVGDPGSPDEGETGHALRKEAGVHLMGATVAACAQYAVPVCIHMKVLRAALRFCFSASFCTLWFICDSIS